MNWLDELRRGWLPGDRMEWTPDNVRWLMNLHAVALRLRPTFIAEIGVRCGYSGFAMLSAVPTARYLGIDDYSASYGGHRDGLAHARNLLAAFDAEIVVQRSQDVVTLPEGVDLLHIDGEHSVEGCTSDLNLGLRSGVRWMLVDDTAYAKKVGRALKAWLDVNPVEVEWLDNGTRGCALLRVR